MTRTDDGSESVEADAGISVQGRMSRGELSSYLVLFTNLSVPKNPASANQAEETVSTHVPLGEPA